MRTLLLLVIVLAFAACNHRETANEKRLRDTLEKLRIKADFRPLPADEAYAFMNNCYLKRLDSLSLGRRLFIYPLTGLNYHKVFEKDSIVLTAKYLGDTAAANTKTDFYPPPPGITLDKKISWDAKRLFNTAVIKDTLIVNLNSRYRHLSAEEREAWYQKVKPGYMMISYPLYNAHTNHLFIREWLENTSSCGTGRDRDFVFNKINGVWKLQE